MRVIALVLLVLLSGSSAKLPPLRPATTSHKQAVLDLPRGGAGKEMIVDAISGLKKYMKGGKADTLLLLGTTAINTPLSQRLGMSPILGYLALGLLAGPNGQNWIANVHTTEVLADLGVVLFLFEMGIHLSFKTLMQMKRIVFGLGSAQFWSTAIAVAALAKYVGGINEVGTLVVLGGGLALSSSAFVLQLLKDKGQMETTYGRNSFGVLLLQDLMVVPLLVVIPILADTSASVGAAVGSAVLRTTMAVAAIGVMGTYLLPPLFDAVAKAGSQAAFCGVCLLSVLGFSFLTEGLGLSNTLGAFLAGVLLSETRHRPIIESELNPIRGILVGLFFFTVGFEIDLKLIATQWPTVTAIVLGLVSLKTALAYAVCRAFDMDVPTARRCGLVLSQGGEFAFVAFRMARSFGIFSDELCKLMLTSVSLTMALTPMLEDFGAKLQKKEE